jgi:hypothetical protein
MVADPINPTDPINPRQQMADFEVIKRKYKNVLDIITYDDLLERLRRIVEACSKR